MMIASQQCAPDRAGGTWLDRISAGFAADYVLYEQVGSRRDEAGKVRAAQLAAVGRFLRFIVAGNICNAAVLMVCFARTPMADVATVWTFVVVTYSLFIYLLGRSHGGQAAAYASCRGIHFALLNAAIIGSFWGMVPVLFFGGTPAEQLIVACLAIGMPCAASFVLAAIPLAVVAFVVPVAVGTLVAMVGGSEPAYNLIAVLVISYVVVLLAASASHATQFIARVLGQSAAERLATLDALTQLPNRTVLLPALDEAVERCRRFQETFALFSIDLDGFKAVNDRLGHPAGDQLLIQVAGRLASAVRGHDLLARVGGDEFILLARGVQSPLEAADIAERLLALFAGPFAVAGEDVRSALSLGIALAPSDGLTSSLLMERADLALYEAKRTGRNRFRLFEAESDRTVRQRKQWIADLKHAVDAQELHLAFQPILALGDDRIRGFEALLRWTHPELGTISPADFIPAAERIRLIRDIGDFVIEEACRIAATWPEDIRVAVNFSLDQFRSLATVETLTNALARNRLAPERFEIEITESILFQDEPIVLQTVEALHKAGLRLVLDDFGTGFSSLRHLQDLPIDGVKIDRTFTNGLPGNHRSRAIARAVVDLCRTLGICVTAEGVETPEQVATLRALGCDEAQGFWIGRPADERVTAALAINRYADRKLVA